MGQAAIPKQTIQYQSIGFSVLSNPLLFLKVNGVFYTNGYRINYGPSSYRNFFPSYDDVTGEIRLYCQAVTYGQDMPAETLADVEVYLAN